MVENGGKWYAGSQGGALASDTGIAGRGCGYQPRWAVLASVR
jgi:hypothetical protein